MTSASGSQFPETSRKSSHLLGVDHLRDRQPQAEQQPAASAARVLGTGVRQRRPPRTGAGRRNTADISVTEKSRSRRSSAPKAGLIRTRRARWCSAALCRASPPGRRASRTSGKEYAGAREKRWRREPQQAPAPATSPARNNQRSGRARAAHRASIPLTPAMRAVQPEERLAEMRSAPRRSARLPE